MAQLQANASSYRWMAAAVGANTAAGYQLATGKPVLAIGGFNGTDAAPSLAQFKQYVAAKKLHFFIGSGTGMRADSGSTNAQQITAWVQQNYTAKTVDGITLYDLTQPTAGS